MSSGILFAALLSACASAADGPPTQRAAPVPEGQAEAVFAGGCFWCIEADFEKLDGVVEVESGYTGGAEAGPTYKQVSYGKTTHLEAVRVIYDPAKVDYPSLVQYFFRHVDPTQADGQFCDRGPHYTTAVFVADDEQRQVAIAAKKQAQRQLGATVVTPVRDAGDFWLAEDYHQDFYKKNPGRYTSYRAGCGRDQRVRALWGDAKR